MRDKVAAIAARETTQVRDSVENSRDVVWEHIAARVPLLGIPQPKVWPSDQGTADAPFLFPLIERRRALGQREAIAWNRHTANARNDASSERQRFPQLPARV